MPYQDCSKFGSGSDWETEIVFSCGSLITFETSFGTLEACLNILLRISVTLLTFSHGTPTSCFSADTLRIMLYLLLSEGRQYYQGRVFKFTCPGILVRLQIPLWRLWGWGSWTLCSHWCAPWASFASCLVLLP